jgi:hypothetical protein
MNHRVRSKQQCNNDRCNGNLLIIDAVSHCCKKHNRRNGAERAEESPLPDTHAQNTHNGANRQCCGE